jgi:hypothetical protein
MRADTAAVSCMRSPVTEFQRLVLSCSAPRQRALCRRFSDWREMKAHRESLTTGSGQMHCTDSEYVGRGPLCDDTGHCDSVANRRTVLRGLFRSAGETETGSLP